MFFTKPVTTVWTAGSLAGVRFEQKVSDMCGRRVDQDISVVPFRRISDPKPELEVSPPEPKRPRLTKSQIMATISGQKKHIRQLEKELQAVRKEQKTLPITVCRYRHLAMPPLATIRAPLSELPIIDSDSCSAHLSTLIKRNDANLVANTLRWVVEEEVAPVPSVISVLSACEAFKDRRDIIELGLQTLIRVEDYNWPNKSKVYCFLNTVFEMHQTPIIAYHTLSFIERYGDKCLENVCLIRRCALVLLDAAVQNNQAQPIFRHTVQLLKRVAEQVDHKLALSIVERIELSKGYKLYKHPFV